MSKLLIIGLIFGSWAWQSGAISRFAKGYRLEFTGTLGAKVAAGVALKNSKNPIQSLPKQQVAAKLARTSQRHLPDRSTIAADGTVLGHGNIVIKIYRHGVECGRVSLQEVDVISNKKACQP